MYTNVKHVCSKDNKIKSKQSNCAIRIVRTYNNYVASKLHGAAADPTGSGHNYDIAFAFAWSRSGLNLVCRLPLGSH